MRTAVPGLNRLVAAFIGGGNARRQAERDETQSLMNSDYLRTRMAAESAGARKKAAEAQGIAQRNAYLGPEGAGQFISDMTGAPLPLVRPFLDYIQNGNWGTRTVPVEGPTQEGGALSGTRDMPVTDAPANIQPLLAPFLRARQTWAAMRGASNANPQQIAGAHGLYESQGASQRAQQLVEGGDYDQASALNQAAVPGNPIRLHAGIGDTGATYAPGSGAVYADPRLNALLRSVPERNNAAAAKNRAEAARRPKAPATPTKTRETGIAIPAGAMQVGTANGKAIYQAPDGSRYIQR